MADKEALINQFMEVTGVNRERAEFFINASNSQLEVALSSFYEEPVEMREVEAPVDMERGSDSSDDDNSAKPVTAKKEEKPSARGGAFSNVATISSVRNPEPEGEDRGQAYYAGGSEHSGQQVLGPPRKKNPVKDIAAEMFKKAQGGNMEQFDSEEEEPRFAKFEGTGYKLGQSEDAPTVSVPSSSKGGKHEKCDTVTVKVFQQGFTVDDGELRPYEDPRNREFFESITRNEIPAELRKQGKGMVHVNVENHLEEEYVKRAPKFKAFTGSGHTLGSPAPEVSTTSPTSAAPTSSESNAENEARATSDLKLNEGEPSTMISIRLTDGSRLSSRFNLTHTVQDIRQFIITSRPQYLGRNFMLLTTFPNKELVNPADTIQQAGLQNAAILQRMK